MDDKKSKKRTEQIPKQFFDGKTYACQSCKNGHRVRTCNHGRTKPIAPTNQPGRPSSGSKRKCTCPKNCGCKDNCKCDKNCLCTQKMYLMVLVSKPETKDIPRSNSPIPPTWQNEDGQVETLKTVWADASGQLLTDAEAERRQREKEQRESGGGGCCSSKSAEKEDVPKPAPKGGCRHREAVKQEEATPSLKSAQPTPASGNRCTCGTACQCTLCPEHPNNAATRQYNAQTLNLMASQHAYMPSPSMMTGPMYTPATPQESCMGGQPRFFLTRNKPTQQDFQNFFPGAVNGDYVMSYPVDQTPWAMPMQTPSTSIQQFPNAHPHQPVLPPMSETMTFDDQLMDMEWSTQGNDDMWEMRLGDASVDQISQYPAFTPSPAANLQVPAISGYSHTLSPGHVPYDAFDASFQQTSVSSPGSHTFSAPMSTFSPPTTVPATYDNFNVPTDFNFGNHFQMPTPASQTRTSTMGSCCGSREYSPNDMDMLDLTLPTIPLSPIPSPRLVQTGL